VRTGLTHHVERNVVQYTRGRGEILNVRHEYAKKRKAAKDVKRRQARGCSYRCGRWSSEFLIDSF
jgi:hypothetical protein